MGEALTEETTHDGLLISGNMLDYRVPTFVDSPPIEAHIVNPTILMGRLVPRKPAKRAGRFPAGAYQRGRQRDGRSCS